MDKVDKDKKHHGINKSGDWVEITEAERIALKACLNYDTLARQISDNMSVGGVEEFMNALDWNAHQVGSLISSLEKKGLAYPDEDGVNGEPVDIVWITEDGIYVLFSLNPIQ